MMGHGFNHDIVKYRAISEIVRRNRVRACVCVRECIFACACALALAIVCMNERACALGWTCARVYVQV